MSIPGKPHGIRVIKASTFLEFCEQHKNGKPWEVIAKENGIYPQNLRKIRRNVNRFGINAFDPRNRDANLTSTKAQQ